MRLVYAVLILGLGIMPAGCAAAPLRQITLTAADDFTFNPPTLTATVDQPVRLTLKNVGAMPHDITFDTLPAREVTSPAGPAHHGAPRPGAVAAHAEAKREAAMAFTPTRKGTYEFYCAEPGHREAGMKGTLIVE